MTHNLAYQRQFPYPLRVYHFLLACLPVRIGWRLTVAEEVGVNVFV